MTAALPRPASRARTFVVTANGLRHNVFEWTPNESSPAAPQPVTVLLLHGYMDCGASWELCAPRLAESLGARVLAPDLRGFGETDRTPAGSYYHFADYVADVDSLVEGLVPSGERLYVVGHSMGGTVATLYAGARPERVARLALLEGLGPPDNVFATSPDRMRAWLDDLKRFSTRKAERALDSLDAVVARLAMNHTSIDESVLRWRAPQLVRQTEDGRFEWKADPLHRTRSPIQFYAAQQRAFAERVACPVLVVSGGANGFRMPDDDERVSAFGHRVQAEIPDAGHMMHWTKPEELIALLRNFLSS